MNYRPEIDGLRSIAVLAVIFFHLGAQVVGGGFVGVDIFFVISGYLITGIILNEINQKGSFNFSKFYARRARRLFPSLFLVLCATLLISFVIFPPELLQRFGGSLIHAIYSISNFYFWRESGYFDVSSDFKPLLHTWSLSVEEQFYFIWPVILSLVFIRRSLIFVIIALFTLSLFLNEIFLDDRIDALRAVFPFIGGWFLEPASTVFFLAPFRVFEFMLGALVVVVQGKEPKSKYISEVFAFVGLAMIFYSIFFFTKEIRFPSYYALIPCLGAALVIWGRNSIYVYRLLTFKPIVFIGLISYTLYLVHWPSIVFYKYITSSLTINLIQAIAILLFTFVVSVLIYRFIEQPIRFPSLDKKSLSYSGFGLTCVLLSLLLLLPGIHIYKGSLSGMANVTFDEGEVRLKALAQIDKNRCQLSTTPLDRKEGENWVCRHDARVNILTVGNSHELHGYQLIRNLYKNHIDNGELNIVYASVHAQGDLRNGNNPRCEFHRGGLPFSSKNPSCEWLTLYLNNFDHVTSEYEAIVLSALRPLDVGKVYVDYVSKLQEYNPNLRVIVVGSLVDMGAIRCADLVNKSHNPFACNDNKYVKYYHKNEEADLRAKWPGLNFYYIDQRKYLCGNSDFEKCDIAVDGIPIIFDAHHFTDLAIPKLIALMRNNGDDKKLEDYIFSDFNKGLPDQN